MSRSRALKIMRRLFPEQPGVTKVFVRRGPNTGLIPRACVVGCAKKQYGRWYDTAAWIAPTWDQAIAAARP